ncbi:MAG: MazG nucleotide pyrophosphohydrolase domain-containing protein, partial [Gemmatimonadota bacterium]
MGSGADPDGSGESPEHAVEVRAGDELLARSLALVRFLREHCPWDAVQTAETLRPYLLEESHETAEAILAGDDVELRSELGDL